MVVHTLMFCSRLIQYTDKALEVIPTHGEKIPNGNAFAWRPRTIVVVVDLVASLVLTGASQPACKNHEFWENVMQPISRRRCGENFAKEIDNLSKSFSNQAYGVKKESWKEISEVQRSFAKTRRNPAKLLKNSKAVEQLYNRVRYRRSTP